MLNQSTCKFKFQFILTLKVWTVKIHAEKLILIGGFGTVGINGSNLGTSKNGLKYWLSSFSFF